MLEIFYNILSGYWNQAIEGVLKPVWTSLFFWRLISLISFTCLSLIVFYKDLTRKVLFRDDLIEIDKNSFVRIDSMIDETILKKLISELKAGSHISIQDYESFCAFYETLNSVKNNFLNQRLEKSRHKLYLQTKNIVELLKREYIATESLFSKEETEIHLPEDIEDARYALVKIDLDKYSKDFEINYRKFRFLIKKNLLI